MKKIVTFSFILCFCTAVFAQNNSPYWSITGNNNETGTSKMGTINNTSLHFYTNNSQRMYIDSSNGRVGIGTTAPQDRLHINSSSGENSFRAQVGGSTKLLVYSNGGTALGSNVTPPSNGLYVYGNTGLGNTTPVYKLQVKGDIDIDSGAYRFAGDPVLKYNVSNQSIAVGNAGGTGTRLNTAVGYQALNSNSTGQGNTAIGHKTLYNDNTGYSNVAIGSHAMYSNTSGMQSIGIGDSALFNNTASSNVAVGSKALYANTTGSNNTANGYQALYSNTIGSRNTANGFQALYANTTGYANTAIGLVAMEENTTGYFNTAVGTSTLYYNTESFNTAVGYDALGETSASRYNTAIGYSAGGTWNNGYNNVFVGANTDVNADGYYNVIAIGQGAVCTSSNQVTMGNSSTGSYRAYANWSNISDGRVKKNIKQNIPGLAFINKLQPITYTLDLDAADKIIQYVRKDSTGKIIPLTKVETNARKAKEQVVYTGFVAQDVDKVAKDMRYDFSGVDAPKNDKDLYGLRYAEFVVPLVKAVQELSKQNDQKDSSLTKQQEVNADLQNQINQLKAMITNGDSATGSSITTATKTLTLSSAVILQNVPNPFTNSTAIQYSLPSGYNNAMIVITDKAGKTLKTVALNGSYSGNLQVEASTLAAGAYQYALIVDGKLVDTKQMIRVK